MGLAEFESLSVVVSETNAPQKNGQRVNRGKRARERSHFFGSEPSQLFSSANFAARHVSATYSRPTSASHVHHLATTNGNSPSLEPSHQACASSFAQHASLITLRPWPIRLWQSILSAPKHIRQSEAYALRLLGDDDVQQYRTLLDQCWPARKLMVRVPRKRPTGLQKNSTIRP